MIDLKRLVVNLSTGAKYDVYVGRGSIWGNPFTHLPLGQTLATVQVATREEAIDRYEDWLLNRQPFLMSRLHELRGKVLACHCAPALCHATVLARYANL
jgi:hypothetical protein